MKEAAMWYTVVLVTSSVCGCTLAFSSFRGGRAVHFGGSSLFPGSAPSSKHGVRVVGELFAVEKGEEEGGGGGSEQDNHSWIERSTPTGLQPDGGGEDLGVPSDYALRLDGASYELGPLSRQMYDALTRVASARFDQGVIPSELRPVYAEFAMNLSAKEAVVAALNQTGLEMVTDADADADTAQQEWGDVDQVTLDDRDGQPSYDSFAECVRSNQWTPGDSFSFVVRNVRAKSKPLDMKQLLEKLDPSGALREELKKRPEKPDN